MKKILVGINNLTNVEQPAYGNHIHFFYRLGREFADKIEFILYNPRRASIDRMRNQCAKIALENNCDGLLFIDDDVIVPIGSLEHMIAADKDIISGITLIRGYPFHPMVFDFSDKENHYMDNYREKVDEQGLVKCDAVGFSYCLINVERTLRRMFPPYFVTTPHGTEDVWFCRRVKEELEDTTIYAHPGIQTLHILGHDTIGEINLDARKRYEEATNPYLIEDPLMKGTGRGDHPAAYFLKQGIIGKETAEKMAGLIPNKTVIEEVKPIPEDIAIRLMDKLHPERPHLDDEV